MTRPLFKDFEEVSSKAWKQKIQVDLKGGDYNENLIWESPEGIHVKPFYHQDDSNIVENSYSIKTDNWKIGQELIVNDITNTINSSIDCASRGAEAISYSISKSKIDIDSILNDRRIKVSNYLFDFKFLDLEYIKKLAFSEKSQLYFLNLDIIGNLVRSGNWFHNLKKDNDIVENVLTRQESSFYGILSVDMSLYQNAGADMVQQLAYGLSHVSEYLNRFKSIGKAIVFKLAVGSNYFFEIAKIRALRLLWDTLIQEYQLNCKLIISAQPSKRNKTIYDYNSNMIRTTTECMSAVLGGSDIITNLPYDSIYHKDNEFGSRIARNQLLVLKHESYFDKVNNAADGSYYIEDLTAKLATKALDLFKEIEKQGGFLKLLKVGTIQRKIKESASSEQKQFEANEEILIGTNKYINNEDRMKQDIEIYPFMKQQSRKTLIEPIIERRLAEKIEKERLELEDK